MAQKARCVKGFGVFGGVGDSKEEGERSRGREVAGRAAVLCVAADGVGWRVLEGAGEAVGVDGGRIITLGTMYSCTVYAGV